MTSEERWEELGHSPERHTPAMLTLAEAVDDVRSYFDNLTTGMAWVVVDDTDYDGPEVYGPFHTEHDAAVYAQGRFPSEDADLDGTTAWVVQVQFP